jgi:hypothetical protein
MELVFVFTGLILIVLGIITFFEAPIVTRSDWFYPLFLFFGALLFIMFGILKDSSSSNEQEY